MLFAHSIPLSPDASTVSGNRCAQHAVLGGFPSKKLSLPRVYKLSARLRPPLPPRFRTCAEIIIVRTSLWPRRSWTAQMSYPSSSRWRAKGCRKVWLVARFAIPAFRTAAGCHAHACVGMSQNTGKPGLMATQAWPWHSRFQLSATELPINSNFMCCQGLAGRDLGPTGCVNWVVSFQLPGAGVRCPPSPL